MTNALSERGTLAIVAADFGGPQGALSRAQAFARLWGGPVAVIRLDEDGEPDVEANLPGDVIAIAPSGEVARALQHSSNEALAEAALSSLLAAAAENTPLAHVFFIAGAPALPLLPALSRAAFPHPVDLELLPSADVPDEEWLWEHCDGLLIGDDSRLYQLSAGRPASPVRVTPPGETSEAECALRGLPWLGGEPRVSVVAPLRGAADLAVRMTESVFEHTPGLLEVILVTDAPEGFALAKLEKLAGRDNRVRLLVHRDQRGFAASCNQGLAAARGDLAVILSADAVVTPGWAGRLAQHLAARSNAGAVGPLSNRASGLQQIVPVDYNDRTLAGLALFSDRLARSAQGHATGVVGLSTFCLALSRPALRRVGGFDPRFFPEGYEDDDFCLRLIAGGLVPYRADDTFVHRDGRAKGALEQASERRVMEENWARFKEKWGLPPERPQERHFSPEELTLAPYRREIHFIAPWKAVTPLRVP